MTKPRSREFADLVAAVERIDDRWLVCKAVTTETIDTHRSTPQIKEESGETVKLILWNTEEQTRSTIGNDPAQPYLPNILALNRLWPVSAPLGANTYILSGYSEPSLPFSLSR